MPDGNTVALRQYEAHMDADDQLMTIASAKRRELVAGFIADMSGKNDAALRDYLADLAAEDGEFLHALQRGDLTRMQALFRDAVDFRRGDDLVDAELQLLKAEKPCRCRGETCSC